MEHIYHDLDLSRLRRPRRKGRGPLGKPRGQARILSDTDLVRLEQHIATASNAPHSNRLKVYLTIYAGLRVGEVCQMLVADLLQKDGSISPFVRVRARIAKGNRERVIPMHPKIRAALVEFIKHHPNVPYIAFSHRGAKPKQQSLTALTNYLSDLYQKASLFGCSSHTGRRTFITNLARNANGTDFSLRDVQRLAGHARLDTTEKYIGLGENLANFVGSLK
ncbi:MAG: site-specific integrase [Erythrobacter sp.]|nr:MAG: site-specific integrase [Erythrobacter sp.]